MTSQLTNTKERLDKVAPIIYTSGKSLFKRYMDNYVIHTKGYFILAPSGSGKTYYVNHQRFKDWIDGDVLWDEAGAFPAWGWWKGGFGGS